MCYAKERRVNKCVPFNCALIGAAVNGGNILKSALTGAISGAAFAYIGGLNGISDITRVGYHALAGGVSSVIQGGKFGAGFLSAGFAKFATLQLTSAGVFNMDKKGFGDIMGRTTVAAVVGGTASKLGGGKFANGARTAAMAHLLNAELSNGQEGQLSHDYEFETEICSRSGFACTADNVWGVVKDNSVPLQDGRLTDGTVSKIPGIGTVTTDVDDSSYTLTNRTHDDHLFKHGRVTRSLVVTETSISVRTVGTGTNTNRFTQGANYAASPYFKALDTNIQATIAVQQLRSDVKSWFDYEIKGTHLFYN